MKYKVGDLIQDKNYPEDGMAIIIEINSSAPLDGYRLFCLQTGRTDWYDTNYVEKDCEPPFRK